MAGQNSPSVSEPRGWVMAPAAPSPVRGHEKRAGIAPGPRSSEVLMQPPSARRRCATLSRVGLLDGDGGAGFFQLLLDFFRFLLGNVFLHVLRSAFDQVLGFLQAEVRTDAADFLDHVDLLVATGGQNNGELGLLFGGFGRSGGARRGGGDR